jgi:DnaK suppressor protein
MSQEIKIMASETMHQKTALKATLAELLGASSRIEELQIENLADPLDQIKSALDREMAMNQLEAQAHLVQDVRAALDAIDDGTYGFCESCEEPIPLKRLKAVPWARRCVRCQMDVEPQRRDRSSVIDDAA